MAVPKKRTGKSAQGHRRSNWKATLAETAKCKIVVMTNLHTPCVLLVVIMMLVNLLVLMHKHYFVFNCWVEGKIREQ